MTRILSHFEAGKLGAWLARQIRSLAARSQSPRPITLKEKLEALRPEIKPGKETAAPAAEKAA